MPSEIMVSIVYSCYLLDIIKGLTTGKLVKGCINFLNNYLENRFPFMKIERKARCEEEAASYFRYICL